MLPIVTARDRLEEVYDVQSAVSMVTDRYEAAESGNGTRGDYNATPYVHRS